MAVAVADRQVAVEFVFDRAGESALARAYWILVPERRGRIEHRSNNHDECSDLCQSVLGPPEGGTDDRLADRGASRGGRALGA